VKHLSLLLCLLFAAGCKDPFGFGPPDPKKTPPPAAPVQTQPRDGEFIDNYEYPQDVEMKWRPVTGARYYQVEAYTSQSAQPEALYRFADNIYSTSVDLSFGRYGWYWWRVRAYSPNWTWYTDWSPLSSFLLPNPAD